jgi:NitT/TauT family transport system substrate-binding protein
MTGERPPARGRAAAAALAALLLLAAACGAPAAAPAPAAEPAAPAAPPPSAASPPPLAPLKYGSLRGTGDIGIFIADAKGYFKEAGVEVELVNFASATEMLPALATGQLDAGGTTPVAAVVNAVARGVDVKTVAERGSILPGFGYSAVVVRKDLIDSGRVRDYPDLRGLQIGVGAPLKAGGGSVQLLAALEKGGLQWEDVSPIALGFPDMVAALGNGSVDATVMSEPWVSNATTGGYGVRWKGLDEVYPGQMLAGIGYSPVMTQQRPDAARAFMVAYVRGARDYLDAIERGRDKDEVLSIMAQYSQMDRAALERMGMPGVKPDPFVNREAVARDIENYVRWGTVTERVELDRLIDDQWVQYAVDKLGPYR